MQQTEAATKTTHDQSTRKDLSGIEAITSDGTVRIVRRRTVVRPRYSTFHSSGTFPGALILFVSTGRLFKSPQEADDFMHRLLG